MGIFISMEGEETGHICISVEGVVVPVNIESVARACALMLGVIYALNLAYPKELRVEFFVKLLL